MGVLQDMQKRAPRVVQALRLTSQAAAIVHIIVQDVEHRVALIAEALIDVVEIPHDVQQSATALLGLPDAHLQFFPALSQGRAGGDQRFRFDLFQPRGFFHGAVAATHCFFLLAKVHEAPARGPVFYFTKAISRSLATSFLKLSNSFSKAIILSSRPTTTSSNF